MKTLIKLFTFLMPITLLFNCADSTSKNENVDTLSIMNDSLAKQPKASYYDSLFNLYGKPIPDSLLAKYLEKDTLELKLNYAVLGCPCPNWSKIDTDPNLPPYERFFYIEAANPANRLDSSKFNAGSKYYAIVKGVFYKEKRFPKEVIDQWNEEPFPYPAKVFRYFEWETKKREKIDTTKSKKIDYGNK